MNILFEIIELFLPRNPIILMSILWVMLEIYRGDIFGIVFGLIFLVIVILYKMFSAEADDIIYNKVSLILLCVGIIGAIVYVYSMNF